MQKEIKHKQEVLLQVLHKMKTAIKYLDSIQEHYPGKNNIIIEGSKLKCDVCGRELTVTKKGSGPLICCMQQMRIIK
jgi:desulfoferrodoxin-like iron-binding protein